jgi:hypothetical protein
LITPQPRQRVKEVCAAYLIYRFARPPRR